MRKLILSFPGPSASRWLSWHLIVEHALLIAILSLAPNNWACNRTSPPIVGGMMKIKAEIMSRLTDNFWWELYALSYSFILWASHAFLNHSQLPKMEKTWSVKLFPVELPPPSPTTMFSCPNRILGGSHWDLPAVSIHVSISTCSAIPLVSPAGTLLWPSIWPWDPYWCGFCYSFHPSGLPLTPLQPVLAPVAFVISTIMGWPSFLCQPLGYSPQPAMVLLNLWADSPKRWPHSLSFLQYLLLFYQFLKE